MWQAGKWRCWASGLFLPLLFLTTAKWAIGAPLNPLSFGSLGASPFSLVGTYVVDTSTTPPTLTRPNASVLNGVVSPEGIAVFTFDQIQIGTGITVNAVGTRPLALLSKSSFVLDSGSFIDVSGAASTNATPAMGGPGGGLGGSGFGNGAGLAAAAVARLLGRLAVVSGVQAATGGGNGGGIGGATYGDLAVQLQGGSGGGSAGNGGGGGGGALEIGALTQATLRGTVLAMGGAAFTNFGDGGGSGGGILVHAETVNLSGVISAQGGNGAAYNSSGGTGGRGAGGGRVLIQSCTLTNIGTIEVNGGLAGTTSGAASVGTDGDPGSVSTITGICRSQSTAIPTLSSFTLLLLMLAFSVILLSRQTTNRK